MITIKKIRTLKPRVQLRKCADVFHEAMTEETEDGYLDEVLSIVFSSDLVSAEDEEKIKRFYAKGKGIGYEDICYHILSILGDSPSDWDQKTEDGEIDWSKRKVMDHYLYLDHLRSPYNVGAIFRNSEAFCINEIYLAPGTASPDHHRAERTSRGTVNAIPWSEKTDIREFEFPERGICMIGSEETGLTREARELALSSCGIVTIPQFGAKGSINVASATAIMLYKWIESVQK